MYCNEQTPHFRHIPVPSSDSLSILSDPDPDPIDVFEIDIPQFLPQAERYRALLSPEETKRAASFAGDHARIFALVSYGLRREILARYRGIAPGRLAFGYGRSGKPFLQQDNDGDLSFSTSRSGKKLLLGICRGRDIGVDIQQVPQPVAMTEIAGRVFHPADAVFLGSLHGEEHRTGFFRIWTLNEAYRKADGRGFSLPSEKIPPMHTLPEDGGWFPSEGRMWFARTVPVSGPYLAAVIVSEQRDR